MKLKLPEIHGNSLAKGVEIFFMMKGFQFSTSDKVNLHHCFFVCLFFVFLFSYDVVYLL